MNAIIIIGATYPAGARIGADDEGMSTTTDERPTLARQLEAMTPEQVRDSFPHLLHQDLLEAGHSAADAMAAREAAQIVIQLCGITSEQMANRRAIGARRGSSDPVKREKARVAREHRARERAWLRGTTMAHSEGQADASNATNEGRDDERG